jgi:hypothetical protein
MSKYDPEMRAFGSLKTECLRCNHWYPDGLVKCPKCGFEDTERRPRSMDPLRSRYSLIRARTILIVCPSAIQVQWKEEMRDKFGLEFRIVYDDLLADLRRRRLIDVLVLKIKRFKTKQPVQPDSAPRSKPQLIST